MTTVVKNENIVFTSIKITDRNMTILKKYFEMNFQKMSIKLDEFDEDRTEWDRHDGQYQKQSSCDYPFTCLFEIEFQNDKTFILRCNLNYKKNKINSFVIVTEDNDWFDYLPQFEKINIEYKICKCGSICAYEKEQCKKCYIYE